MFLRTDYQANIIEDSERELSAAILHLSAEISASTQVHYSRIQPAIDFFFFVPNSILFDPWTIIGLYSWFRSSDYEWAISGPKTMFIMNGTAWTCY